MTKASPSARERLLDAADRLFYAEGVHTVGIDRLISEAGVAKGSLFYNFSGKDELVAAYLAGRDERRRQRIARHQEGLSDPVERLLAVFDALGEAVSSPGYNGCAFANAYAEAPPDSVEARATSSVSLSRPRLRGGAREGPPPAGSRRDRPEGGFAPGPSAVASPSQANHG